MVAHMINNKQLNPIVTELFIRGRKFKLPSYILKWQKMLDLSLHTFLLWKFQTGKTFNKY